MMKYMPRKRTLWLVGGSLVALLYLFLTDPNGGALTAALVGQLAMPIVAVWFAYLARKALFDYLDIQELYNKAKESAVGAGLVFIGTCLVFFGLLGLFGGQLRAETISTQIPTQAYIHLPTLKQEQVTHWGDHPKLICLQA